jgi:hypothetical protein
MKMRGNCTFGISDLLSRLFRKIWPVQNDEQVLQFNNMLSLEAIERNIPYYLTEDAKQGLVKALNAFPKDITYYTLHRSDDLLQGDCWTKFHLFNFATGERATVRGIVLSNSCDVSPDNPRDFPPKIVFAPLMRLKDFTNLLKCTSVKQSKIDSIVASIRNQHITNIFYLPSGAVLDDEYIARLDDLHSMPVKYFIDQIDKRKLCTLSTVGFYLFLFKLSVHFCRFKDEVDRA